jgi:hypothetical protein
MSTRSPRGQRSASAARRASPLRSKPSATTAPRSGSKPASCVLGNCTYFVFFYVLTNLEHEPPRDAPSAHAVLTSKHPLQKCHNECIVLCSFINFHCAADSRSKSDSSRFFRGRAIASQTAEAATPAACLHLAKRLEDGCVAASQGKEPIDALSKCLRKDGCVRSFFFYLLFGRDCGREFFIFRF